jgi:hypothetical protein
VGTLATELAEDGGTAHPEVVVRRPLPHHWRHLVRERSQDRSDAVAGDHVHEVPPGAGDDEVSVKGERLGSLVLPVVAVAGQLDGGVPLLPVGGPVVQG